MKLSLTLLIWLMLSLYSSSGVRPRATCATLFLPIKSLAMVCISCVARHSLCNYLLSFQSIRTSLKIDGLIFSKENEYTLLYSSAAPRSTSTDLFFSTRPFPLVFVRDTINKQKKDRLTLNTSIANILTSYQLCFF